ncbi:acetyl-CoA C-acetyltransferase [Mesorhizobium sp. CAU 1732]|uniref:acetyl-CoA C-acetyltransferase n=1 Tax=Mesorhizobium sp. CAU 1732 TaxID=3140358 RepID=UPI003260B9D8
MRAAYICEPVRTPVGRFGGVFRDVSAADLGSAVVKGLLERTGIAASDVEDVLFAQCYPSMEAPALGRVVALNAGIPATVGGLQIDRRCGSGLQSVIYGALQVGSGANDLVIAGGAESMSNAPFFMHEGRWGIRSASLALHDSLARGRVTAGGRDYPVPGGMIETAENLRRDYSIAREEQDQFAARSHQKAVAAQTEGRFDDEIIPVAVNARGGSQIIVRDEHPRADATVDKLAGLSPIMAKSDPDATVTAGNASGQNDGASAAIIASEAMVARYGLKPFGRLVSWAVAGVAPSRMGIGPVPAVAKALASAGLTLKDVDLIELNEAFASQVLACTREWSFEKADFERMNVSGSGISLGHPVGATGGRILATMLREMHRRGARRGVETMCIGGGQGLAAIFEAV